MMCFVETLRNKDKTFIDTPGTNFSESGGDSMREPLPREVFDAWRETETDSVEYGGHGGSHVYLVHEFVDAVAYGRRPAIPVWEAVRYMAMGIAAHKSALRDGERLDVPDWGDGAGMITCRCSRMAATRVIVDSG